MRPKQWIKNLLVPAAWFFARWDPSQAAHAVGWEPVIRESLAVLCFCGLASAVYLMNDVRDLEADRLHPRKRFRPLAAGELSVGVAVMLAAVLAGLTLFGAYRLGLAFFAVLAGYAVMQVGYSLGLKRVPFLDVFMVAAGFVLRAIAGAVVIGVRISPWLLLCVFLLALFLALCKRRHEKTMLDADSAKHREALAGYTVDLLDIQIAIIAACVIVCYAMYTLSPETVQRFGNDRLGLTTPFVIFGIFRYLHLVHCQDRGGAPEMVLLTDPGVIATVIGYVLAVLAVFLI